VPPCPGGTLPTPLQFRRRAGEALAPARAIRSPPAPSTPPPQPPLCPGQLPGADHSPALPLVLPQLAKIPHKRFQDLQDVVSVDVRRREGAQRAPRGLELVPLGTGPTVLSGLGWTRDTRSAWAALALEGRTASWARGLPPPPPPQEPPFPGSLQLPAASSLGKFRELRQKWTYKRLRPAVAKDDYSPSALPRSPPSSGHRETFQLSGVHLSAFPGCSRDVPLPLSWTPGSAGLPPPRSHLAGCHLLGFVLQEEIHQLVQVFLTVDLEGLGSRGTRLASLRDITRGEAEQRAFPRSRGCPSADATQGGSGW